ncbi:inositol monophosphatase family protein [Pseudoponticoccus marisrubri]|uniref:Inositol monophosphatase n=1 Tax=Pseudoponticoccus marisrubri TaxID=1685382 RepID=A0A0W7WJ65_9RHOB|nr:inositol monophosphatase [Pseudoponticoccus marisrubri]KUF10550.1 inositol monophosphatase [Pseudoponticoccus marisrubri]
MTETLPMTITAPLSNAQRSQLTSLIRRASRAEILPRFRQLGRHQIDQKTGPQDLVTDADRQAEAMITRGLLGMFPHALVVGEEHASDNPKVLDKIAEAELCFTIDPVDGTWNYAHGLSTFGVMVAMLRFGKPVMGMLYDPIHDDFIMADEASAAEMVMPRRVRRKLATSKGGPVEDLLGYASLPLIPAEKRAQMAATFPRFRRIDTLRCACHEYRMLAQGHVDFVLASKMTAWDHPAGALITQRAGGHVAMLDGSDYSAERRSGHLLAVCDAATWGRVRDVFDFLIETE